MPTTQRVQSKNNLAWLDLEMTGLDVENDVIVQAALIITDVELSPLETFSTDIWQPATALERMSPFVHEMHAKTGLLARLTNCRVDLAEAEQKLMEIVTGWCGLGAVLCGNSIWQDRRFVERYMPGLARCLHYRMVDVSALKTLVQRWYPPAQAFCKQAAGEHDALVDIRNSIAELKHYRAKVLRTP